MPRDGFREVNLAKSEWRIGGQRAKYPGDAADAAREEVTLLAS